MHRPRIDAGNGCGNLPAGVSSFLGRREELGEVMELLEGARLVTLTGAPGIGKSRLGLELAGQFAGDDVEGAWLVELAPVRNAKLVPKALAAALSVQEVPGESLTDTVVARVGGRRVLVLLDNCEHLVTACAEVSDALLRGCPELRILATSREPLSISGERVWQVPPLSVPGPEVSPAPERLMGFDAVSLFVERAAAVHPAFSLNADAAPYVAEICRRLDGIPLAIELAAARVANLTPAEIALRLDDRFGLLVRGSRTHVSRHHTLQAAVDWSHELLSAAERTLLRRLSVFVGGFCLEAAEVVCAGEEVTNSEEVLDLLSHLVSKSLVVADTANSRGRYRLLETIRAYAADRLEEADEAAATGEAHARFYLALAERAEPELTGPTQDEWFERLEGERENLRSAIEWSLAQGKAEWALRLTGALAVFWRVRCHFSEGRDLAEAAVAASNGKWPAIKAKALWAAGFMALMTDDREASISALEDSLALFSKLGDVRGRARALLLLANSKPQDPCARALLDESAALARSVGDSWCLSLALFLAGWGYAAQNELPAARPLLEESLTVARGAEEKQGLRAALMGLGKVAVRQGDYRSAEGLLEEAVDIAGELGEEYNRGAAMEYLAELEVGRGNYSTARQLLGEVLAIAEDGPAAARFGPLILLGTVEHAEGDCVRARQRFEEAKARAPGGTLLSRALQGMGQLAADEGERDHARRLFEEALELARAGAQNDWSAAAALHGLGDLARDGGNMKRAAALHNEALNLWRGIGAVSCMVACLEAIGGLAAGAGRHDQAARLLGAAQAQRERAGYARAPWEAPRYQADADLIRRSLASEEFDAAVAEGAGLSIEEAATQASKGRGRRGRPPSGWSSLTEMEQQVATLVAEGLTNPEIAERLLVSVATVKAHVSRIFPKLDVTGRRELAREVQRRDEPPT